MHLPTSVPGVVDVELLRGVDAAPDALPCLLIEAPHGATERSHYDALAERMASPLPADLHAFFHLNTDVGSWEVGRRVAERVVAADPTAVVVVLRCLIPRTLVDVNRTLAAHATDLTTGGLTAALPPYVTDRRDHHLLIELHRAYTTAAEQAYASICPSGGRALIQHTYGPVSLGIPRVDADIVTNLRAAHEPEVYATWPVRPEVDLITVDETGRDMAPPGAAATLQRAYTELGVEVVIGGSYTLHPSTMGRVWCERFPGQVLTLEIRRDLLVEQWLWDQPMVVRPDAVDRFAAPLAALLG